MVDLDVRVGNAPVETPGPQDITANTRCMYYSEGAAGKVYMGGDCDQPINARYVTMQQKVWRHSQHSLQ